MDPAPGRHAAAAGLGADRQGECYRVYTPYARACRAKLRSAPLAAVAAPRPNAAGLERGRCRTASTASTRLRTRCARSLPAGEDAAGERLAGFVDEAIEVLPGRPRLPVATRHGCLSPYLAAGVLSAGAARGAGGEPGRAGRRQGGIATWINELLWREFYQHLLAAYPELSMHRPMKPETAHVPWRDAPRTCSPGRKAGPASPSSTPPCASCWRWAGCTTGCAW